MLAMNEALTVASLHQHVLIDAANHTMELVVSDDKLSLAIGKKGQNVRLTAKLTHWHIDIMTEEQARKVREAERAEVYKIPLLPPGTRDKSQGLWVVKNAEFSVEEPIAYSSILVLPTITASAAKTFSITWALYGA